MTFISRVFVLSVFSTFAVFTQFNEGSYKTEWKLAEPCPEYKHVNLPSPFYDTWRKVNRTHFGFSGNLTVPTIYDAQSSLRLVIKKWCDGGWRTYVNVTKRDPCKILTKHFSDLYSSTFSAANNKPVECPPPIGVYVWKNYVLRENSLKLNFLIGDLDINIYLIKHDVVQLCVHLWLKTTQLYKY